MKTTGTFLMTFLVAGAIGLTSCGGDNADENGPEQDTTASAPVEQESGTTASTPEPAAPTVSSAPSTSNPTPTTTEQKSSNPVKEASGDVRKAAKEVQETAKDVQ